uniref:Rab-GAP TBC domain-containing protein n=1 Tax=Globisporangium ultimum (strain ATCC 200006 / CBS 805.95 / DAOM BR144) TaxID=431595 RepID=K3WR42_GLOUD
MGGGFGFGLLADVQMLGFYQAQHPRTHKHFLAYVLQIATTSSHFLIYRRYSQIAGLSTKLHFHPAVGLPPKYALQVFPLTDEQLKQRFEGLQAFMSHVFMHLRRQFDEGMHHDVNSSAGLDMQIFYDFIAHHRNRPPAAVKTIPEWAKPTILHGVQSASGSASTGAAFSYTLSRSSSVSSSFGNLESTRSHDVRRSTWQDIDSITDSEDVGMAAEDADAVEFGDDDDEELVDVRLDTSNQFRNEILQAEGNLNALWNCVKAYTRATNSWWVAASAVVDEYKRVGDMSLFNTPTPKVKSNDENAELAPVSELESETTQRDKQNEEQEDVKALNRYHSTRLASVYNRMMGELQPEFEHKCDEDVLAPLEALVRGVLPEVKHSYWTRLANMRPEGGAGANAWHAENVNVRGLLQERDALHQKIKEDVQESMTALIKIQNALLSAMQTKMHPFESVTPAKEHEQKHVKKSSDHVQEIVSYDEATEVKIAKDDDQKEDVLKEERASEQEPDPSTPKDSQQAQCNDELASETTEQNEDAIENGQDDNEHSTRVWVWGRPPSTETGTPLVLRPKQVPLLNGQSIIQIACGGEHLLYLTDTGDVYSYGDNEEKKAYKRGHLSSFLVPRLVEEFALEKALHRTKIIKVACGAQHSVGITEVGELYTWGSGEDGRLGHGDMRDRAVPRKIMSLLRERVVHASCGGAHTAALTDKNKVFTFGRGRNGRLGLGDNKWRDTPHEVTSFPPLGRDGSVFSWGKQGEGQCGLGYLDKDQLVPRNIEKLLDSHIIDIACGYTHTLALTSKGEVYSWGLGEYGQLGRGIVYQPVPELVDFSSVLNSPDRIVRVYCGAFHSVVTTETRVMFSWGLNMYGACGLGHTANKDTPDRVDCFAPDRELVVACGHKYTITLEVDQEAVVPSHKVHLSATQPGQLARFASGANLPAPLNIAVISASTSSNDWSTTPTNEALTPKISYSLEPEKRETIHEKEEELRRAKKLWRTRILRDWEESKDTPLAHSMWRQGIPPSIRAKVWPLAIGNKLKITPEMYQIYRRRAIAYKQEREAGAPNVIGREHSLALIDTDLPRTFPSLKLFDASGPYYEFLLEVLETYACYRPDLGYIQGMSYLAAMLCLHMPHDRYLTFQCLANLMVNEHLFTFYLLDAELSGVYYTLFDEFLSARLPALHQHMGNIGISCSMYLMNWFQTLFLQVLPLELAVRVFDNFLLDGTVFLFRTAMAIHELLQGDLLKAEIDEAMPMIQKNLLYQDLWYARVPEDELFRTISNIVVPSHIYSALDRVVNDVFFYEKRGSKSKQNLNDGGSRGLMAHASGGQSVGIGRVKHERRRMYSISDTLNGVLGGF